MVNDLKKADLLLVNGKVITVDSRFSIQQAIAVKNGWIVAVGTDDEIKGLKGSNTQIIDLKGRPLLPGTNDTHSRCVLWWNQASAVPRFDVSKCKVNFGHGEDAKG